MKSILLIDDDELVLKTLARALERAGYAVLAFQDPREAVRQAALEEFDLVITDIRMPHIDGFQALRYVRELRSSKNQPAVPEIIITGYAEETLKSAGEGREPAVIFKPIDLNQFLSVVKSASTTGKK
jgi:CheY-like chemotaxis protein